MNSLNFRLMQSIITNVRHNCLTEPIKRMALERSKTNAADQTPFSIYRDILFLAFTVLGSGNINLGKILLYYFKNIHLFWAGF